GLLCVTQRTRLFAVAPGSKAKPIKARLPPFAVWTVVMVWVEALEPSGSKPKRRILPSSVPAYRFPSGPTVTLVNGSPPANGTCTNRGWADAAPAARHSASRGIAQTLVARGRGRGGIEHRIIGPSQSRPGKRQGVCQYRAPPARLGGDSPPPAPRPRRS